MPIQHQVKLHLYLALYSWEKVPRYITSENDSMEKQNDENYTYEYIRPVEFVIPTLTDPAEIDPTQFRLKGIRKAQNHLMAEYQAKMTGMKAHEQSLLAIEG
jgi:hypothetical protein